MRILHTADWHLGARLGVHDRGADQQAALDSVVGIAADTKPDLIVHAGDVWDLFHPSHDSLDMGLAALCALGRIAPTVVVGGNHDSFKLLRAVHRVLGNGGRKRQVWVATEPGVVTVPGPRASAPPTAVVACMPFASRAAARAASLDGAATGTYAAYVASANHQLAHEAAAAAGRRETPVVYAAHLYVAGCRPGASERRVTISDDYATDAGDVPEADYAAFGHIHDAQSIGRRTQRARYAGALVQLSFGEATAEKTTTVVDLDGDECRIEEIRHETGRPLVEVDTDLAGIEKLAADGGLDGRIVRARVRSTERIYDLTDRVLAGSPGIAIHELVNSVDNEEHAPAAETAPAAEPPIEDLFDEWRKTRTGDEREADDTARGILREALKNAEAAGTSDFGAGSLEDELAAATGSIAAAHR